MRFSLIIPIYNSEQTLAQTLDSVLAQTRAFDEIILIDNNSVDNSGEIIKKYAEKFQIIESTIERTAGVSAARNSGIRKASGDYICFLDADDVLVPTMLETLTKTIDKFPDNQAYHYNFWHEYQNGTVEVNRYFLPQGKYSGVDFLTQNLTKFEDQAKHMVWSFCFKRSFLLEQQLKLAQELVIFEDVAFLYEFFNKPKVSIYILAETLVTYKYVSRSSTQTTSTKYYEQLAILAPKFLNNNLTAIQQKYFIRLAVKILHYSDFQQFVKVVYKFNELQSFVTYNKLKFQQLIAKVIKKINN